jgi:uncharacterized protein (TIGR02145 family)
MGTYKVFNGTDWVNICDCQVHVRNASNDWQLLDPANCVTKYWTGTEWCEIICTPLDPCDCSTGEVVIGTQTWTCRNLDVETYRNGTVIPQVTDPTQWGNLTTGAWCYYNNDPSTEATYGKLYNWFAVNDSRGLAPNGYHIPSQTEWITLQTYLGGDTVAGGKMKEVGTSHWNSPNVATNDSCFTSLPGGLRAFDGSFDGIQYYAHYWTSTANSGSMSPTAYEAQLVNDSSILNISTAFATRGYSVRLIKD